MKNLLLIFPFVVVAAWASLKRRFVRAARDQKEVVRCWFCDLMSGPRHGFLWPTVKWVPPLGNTIPNFWREVRLAKWLFWSSKLYWLKNCFVISYYGLMFSWILQKIARERNHLMLGKKTKHVSRQTSNHKTSSSFLALSKQHLIMPMSPPQQVKKLTILLLCLFPFFIFQKC